MTRDEAIKRLRELRGLSEHIRTETVHVAKALRVSPDAKKADCSLDTAGAESHARCLHEKLNGLLGSLV